jgi:hypothetical protein
MKLVTETNSGISWGDQAIVLGREAKHKAKHRVCL